MTSESVCVCVFACASMCVFACASVCVHAYQWGAGEVVNVERIYFLLQVQIVAVDAPATGREVSFLSFCSCTSQFVVVFLFFLRVCAWP